MVIPLKVVTNLAEVDLCFSQICHFRTFNDNGVHRRIVEVIYLLLALHQHNFSFILGNVACKRGGVKILVGGWTLLARSQKMFMGKFRFQRYNVGRGRFLRLKITHLE